MATQEYRPPSLSDLLVSPYRLDDPKAAHIAARNALDMLNDGMASMAEVLASATMNEDFPLGLSHVRNVSWLLKGLLDVQQDIMTIHANAEYVMTHPDDDEIVRLVTDREAA